MTLKEIEEVEESLAAIDRVMSLWIPDYKHEPFTARLTRLALGFSAYDADARRVINGESPIYTDYPIPLPEGPVLNLYEVQAHRNGSWETALVAAKTETGALTLWLEHNAIIRSFPERKATQVRGGFIAGEPRVISEDRFPAGA